VMINILIVDDSPTDIAILKFLFESEPDMRVVGTAKNGVEAVDLAAKLKPDLITMDLQMPTVDGFEAIRRIMTQNPTPIVVISSVLGNTELNASFQSLEAGALYVMEKPRDILSPAFLATKRFMLDTIRSMAQIKVFRKNRFASSHTHPVKLATHPLKPTLNSSYEVLAIGASVGGPQALKVVLSSLPADFPLPIVVVQHMSVGFLEGFANWMNAKTQLKVKAAENMEVLHPGTVYIAPDHFHLEVARSHDVLTAHAVGVLMTGMGNDGASGMLELKKLKGHTLVQDPESAVVFGMGAVAQTLGAVDVVVELDKMAEYLARVCKK
jgi:two-component system chemotaxis response regulator CheB